MINRRIVVNLITFFVAAAVLIGFGLVNLLGNPMKSPTLVSTVLPNADGLYNNFSVTLNGVQVGTVRSVALTSAGARVTMAINPGVHVPGDVAAQVEVANPLGEQQIDLVPQRGGTAQPLVSGEQIPVSSGGAPANIGQVIATATTFLKAIPVGNLNNVLHQLSVAFNGRASAIRTLIQSGQQFSKEFLSYQQSFKSLLSNAPPVMNSVTAAGPQLTDALTNTAVFFHVLSVRQQDLLSLFRSGANASQLLNQLVVNQRPNLACLVHDLATINNNVAQPTNLSNLSTALSTSQQFFGIIDAATPRGPARGLFAGDPSRNSQVWIRVRLLLPPELSPAAVAYSTPHTLPPILPGAGCVTEFGNGVAAASQPGFTPAAHGVPVITASAADAQVRGGGAPLGTPPAASTSNHSATPAPSPGPASPTTALPLMGAAVLLRGPVKRRIGNRRGRNSSAG